MEEAERKLRRQPIGNLHKAIRDRIRGQRQKDKFPFHTDHEDLLAIQAQLLSVALMAGVCL